MFSYKPLRRLLVEHDMSKTDLRLKIKCSTATLARFSKDEYVSMEILNSLCKYFNCRIQDIIEYIPDPEDE